MKILRTLFFAVLFLILSCGPVVFSSEDIPLNKIEKSFWDNGNIRLIRYYHLSGALKETSFYDKTGSLEKLINYDKLGNRIAVSHYNQNGRLKTTSDGWASVRWEYRGKRLFRVSYFDDRGELIECKEYNEFGNLLENSSYQVDAVKYVKDIGKTSVSAGSETLSY